MFEQINKELETLKTGIYRKRKLDSTLKNLRTQLDEQKNRQRQLELELDKENLDVEKISKMSVTALFYSILGSREKQLEKERQEALAAQLKYDDIKRQISDTRRRISELEIEQLQFLDCESKYNELYQKKYEALRQSNQPNGKAIVELENKIANYKANLNEISEAISAGNSVIESLNRASESLDSAEGWGMWDMWGGGGLITNMMKHSHIDDARDAASEVQTLLNRFHTELADIKLSAGISIEISEFDKFADFFFDGLISDWIVQSKINDSQDSVDIVGGQVNKVLSKLSGLKANQEKGLAELEDQLSQIVSDASF